MKYDVHNGKFEALPLTINAIVTTELSRSNMLFNEEIIRVAFVL